MRSILAAAFVLLTSAIMEPAYAQAPAADRRVDPVERRALTFESHGATLAGTLFRPAGMRDPAVLVVTHGASSPSRDLPLYEHLTDLLPRLGMAVFVYDRRGSGESGGELAQSDYAMLADDAIAGGRRVLALHGFENSRVGYWGLSQGGWLAMLAASRDAQAAFSIAVSAPFVTPDVQMMHATENILRIGGYDQREIDLALDARRASDGFLRGEVDRESAQRRLSEAAVRPWFDRIYMSRTLGDPATSRWLREMNHDPVVVLQDLDKPTLVIFGETDPWIPVKESVDAIENVRRPEDFTLVVLPGVDHSMMVSATPIEQIDPNNFARNRPESPRYFSVLSAWLAERGFTRIG